MVTDGFLHYDLNLNKDDVVEVTLDRQANVRLMDSVNYQSYRSGAQHRYFGGHVKKSPVLLPAPGAGQWHLVVDLGGYPGTVRAKARVLKGAV